MSRDKEALNRKAPLTALTEAASANTSEGAELAAERADADRDARRSLFLAESKTDREGGIRR